MIKRSLYLLGLPALALLSLAEPEPVRNLAEPKKLSDSFHFTEGPVADADGNILFSDIPDGKIHKWSHETNAFSVQLKELNRVNGLFHGPNGQLLGCGSGDRSIVEIDPDKGPCTIVDHCDGRRFNSPNDLWVDARGGIYFSDPRYGRKRDDMEFEGEYVFYISPDRKSVSIAADGFVRPNGLHGSLDGKTLYIADRGDSKTYAYQISKAGKLRNRRLFAPVGSDGMTIDELGNVYLTNQAVEVYSPQGTLLHSIDGFNLEPTNVCFGGPDFTTLFVTARKEIYLVPMNTRGGIRKAAEQDPSPTEQSISK